MGSNRVRDAGGFNGCQAERTPHEMQLSLIECIEFHKVTFFGVDAAERLKYYLMCSVKKPMKWSI